MFFSLLGAGLMTWQAPRLITWYVKPPVEWGVTCTPALEWSLARMAWFQVGGLASGAILGLYVYFAFLKKKKAPASSQTNPAS